MKSSGLSVIQGFMHEHNIQQAESLDEDLCDYILEACSGDMLSEADKCYLIEDMILGVTGETDGQSRAKIIDEFIVTACRCITGMAASNTTYQQYPESGVEASLECNIDIDTKEKPDSVDNKVDDREIGTFCRSGTHSTPDASYPEHLAPMVALLSLHNVDISRVDINILEYVVQLCVDDQTSDADLVEVVTSYLPEMCPDDADTIGAVAQSLRDSALECSKRISRGGVSGSDDDVFPTTAHGDSDEAIVAMPEGDGQDAITSPVHPDVAELCLICPHIPADIISYVYAVKFASVVADAGQFLLENCSEGQIEMLRCSMEQYNTKQQKEAEERLLRSKAVKCTIFQRYGETPLPPGHREKKAPKAATGSSSRLLGNTVHGHTADSRMRYRDGKVVTTKGEKVIIEKNPKDDYDGGSRGRIKTKGKRGPGFIIG